MKTHNTQKSYFVIPEKADANPTMVDLVGGGGEADNAIMEIKIKGSEKPVPAWVLTKRQFELLCSNRRNIPFNVYVRRGDKYVAITFDDLNPQDGDLLETVKRTKRALKGVVARHGAVTERRGKSRLATNWAAGEGRL